MAKKLIFTADDYGMCEPVNQAIDECLAAGVVRATCAMANMSAFGPTVDFRERFPESSLGIHWTLTEGQPVLPALKVPSLVRSDGSFYPPSALRKRWLRRQVSTTDVESELQAQYQRFHEAAGEPDFWNSHQNFHVWPGLFQICVALGQRLRIPIMRSHHRYTIPRDGTAISYYLSHPVSWLKSRVISGWASHARSQGMLMPDGLVYMPGYSADQASLEEVVTRLPWDSIKDAVEIIVHPATTPFDPLFHRHAERRVLEYRILKDARLSDCLHSLGVELINFQALRNIQ